MFEEQCRGSSGRMFLPRWPWLLTLYLSTCGLGTIGHGDQQVTCSQGLSDCTMEDWMPLADPEDTAVTVTSLTPKIELCCRDEAPCTLCLVIDAELYVDPAQEPQQLVMQNSTVATHSVTVCFQPSPNLPACKKVEFKMTRADVSRHGEKVSMVIYNPAGVSYSSHVAVYPSDSLNLTRVIVAPSHNEACAHERQTHTEECKAPVFNYVIKEDHVELQLSGRNSSLLSACVQYERNGMCQKLDGTTIPLSSVTPCTCLQIWDQDDTRPWRSLSCPFQSADFSQRNVWRNLSVSVGQAEMNSDGDMFLWNLSAPCRLEGEVWPCRRVAGLGESSCVEIEGFRQKINGNLWRQKSNGLWEKRGVFEDIDLQLSPCVMVKLGTHPQLGPFCCTNRWRWSLLLVAVMLLVPLTVVLFCVFRDFLKRWVRSHHEGFVKILRKGHVVVLTPPEVDRGVSESVCRLGSLLSQRGLSVAVDLWCREDQRRLGPLPWLHSQLQEQSRLGGPVLLVLTPQALEAAEEWSRRQQGVVKAQRLDKDLLQICSDLFTASLCLIRVNKQLGTAGGRFLLVSFDSDSAHLLSSKRSVLELLQGLPLFQLPSQMQALLSELA